MKRHTDIHITRAHPPIVYYPTSSDTQFDSAVIVGIIHSGSVLNIKYEVMKRIMELKLNANALVNTFHRISFHFSIQVNFTFFQSIVHNSVTAKFITNSHGR